MLYSGDDATEAVRFSTADSLDRYVAGSDLQKTVVSHSSSWKRVFFLGLRLNRGVNLREVRAALVRMRSRTSSQQFEELVSEGLLQSDGDFIRLTPRGRLFSNEVFERFIALPESPTRASR